MTKQEAFDRAARHLIAQGRKSSAEGAAVSQCMYRGPGSTKCAIGALLTEDEVGGLHSVMGEIYNTRPVTTILRYHFVESIRSLDVDFLERLQAVHDGNAVPDWPLALRLFAEKWGLKATCVEEAMAANPGFPK